MALRFRWSPTYGGVSVRHQDDHGDGARVDEALAVRPDQHLSGSDQRLVDVGACHKHGQLLRERLLARRRVTLCLSTSGRFDVLDVSLGVGHLQRRGGKQLLTPAAHVVVEVDDAKAIFHLQVVQNRLHGFHRLQQNLEAQCILGNGGSAPQKLEE